MAKSKDHHIYTITHICPDTKFVVIGAGIRGDSEYFESNKVTHNVYNFDSKAELNDWLDSNAGDGSEIQVFELKPVALKTKTVTTTKACV